MTASPPLQSIPVPGNLNERTASIVRRLSAELEVLRGSRQTMPGGGTVIDLGVKAQGGLEAGLRLAEVCLSGLGSVSLTHRSLGGQSWPAVEVRTDHPVPACLFSQYAGWQLSHGKFFGMGSGPMRAAAGREELFATLGFQQPSEVAVGAVETGRLPTDEVFAEIAQKTKLSTDAVTLLVARTASAAGNLQVVARSVETALHKLFETGFDVSRLRSGFGVAPLPPVAPDDLTGIGWTNDAILYGASVTLWVVGDDDSLATIGPKIPANASAAYGKPFLEIFEEAGRDFYKIDPHLFSPAEILFQNLETGRVHRFGRIHEDLLRRSYRMA